MKLENIPKQVEKYRGNVRNRHSNLLGTLSHVLNRAMPLMVLGLIVIIFLEFSIELTPGQERILLVLDNIIIGLFALDILVGVVLDKSKKAFIRHRWFDILLLLPLLGWMKGAGRIGRFFEANTRIAKLGHAEQALGRIGILGEEGIAVGLVANEKRLHNAMKLSHAATRGHKLSQNSVILSKMRGRL